jgi:hypothetical protein
MIQGIRNQNIQSFLFQEWLTEQVVKCNVEFTERFPKYTLVAKHDDADSYTLDVVITNHLGETKEDYIGSIKRSYSNRSEVYVGLSDLKKYRRYIQGYFRSNVFEFKY